MTPSGFSFPLYDSLDTADIADMEFTTSDKAQCAILLQSLDTEGRERAFMLIKKHQALSEPGGITKASVRIPYNGKRKRAKKDIEFDLNEMPEKLCKLLYKFAQMHLKTMEDENHESQRPSLTGLWSV